MNNNQSITPKLISDIPAIEDKFGTHKRIAEAIHRLIINNDGGKTISIQGQWGSGKSTVIKILSKIFDGDDQSLIINYDAWIHSGDPLRRAFFNTVIESIQKKTWLSFPESIDVETIKRLKHLHEKVLERCDSDADKHDEFWTLFKDSLSGKVKHVIKKTTPTVDESSKSTIALLLYFPIAALMAVNMFRGYVMDDYFFMEWPNGIHALFWICVLVALLPLYKIFSKKLNSKSLSIFLSKTITDEETDQVEEPDLTSIEFKELFSFVMKIALIKNTQRRIIVVIDNLDRLKNDEHEQVWSMLKSFIDHSSFDSEIDYWVNRLWVIIPRADSHEQEVDYFEKIFQLKFTLPPPISTYWQVYLKELLINSFLNITSEETEKIKDIFDWHVINGSLQTPTPRNLKTFINDLVWLATLWGDTFSKAVLASYLLDTRKLESTFVNDLTNKKIPSRLSLNLLGKQLDDAYASIYFNIENSAVAKSFVYVPMFEDFLREGNSQEICKLIKLNPHSISYLGTALRRLLPNSCKLTPWLYFHSVIAMQEVKKDFEELFQLHLNTSFDIALSEIEDLPGLPLVEENSNKGLMALVNMQESRSEEVRRKVFNALKNSTISEGVALSYRPDISNILDWCQRLDVLINDFNFKDSLSDYEQYSILLPLKAAEWRVFIDYHKEDFSFYKVFKPFESHKQISAYVESVSFSKLEKALFIWLYQLNFIEEYEDALNKILFDILAKTYSEEQFEMILDLILVCNKSQPILNLAKDLHSSGRLLSEYARRSNDPINDLLGKIVLSILLVDPKFKLPLTPDAISDRSVFTQLLRNPDAKADLLKNMSELIKSYKLERLIIDYALQVSGVSKLATLIFESHGDKELIYEQLNINSLDVELFGLISAISNKPYESEIRSEALRYLTKNKSLLDAIQNTKITANSFYIFAPLIEMYPDSTTELVSRMTEYFYGLTEIDWGVNITTFTSATRALSRLPNLNIAKHLDGAVKSVLINKEVPSIAAFRVAYGHLCQRSKNKISTLALDSVCESQNALDDELWKVLEIAMFDNLKNIKRKVPKLLQALIRNRDFRGLDLIATKLKSYIVLNVYSVEIAEIRNQLTEMAKISNEAEKKIISKIKSAIKRDAKKLKKIPK